jgi:general secretion pathway protein J
MIRSGDDGYSLVELLVSLAILGFVAVMMLGGIQSGQRVWQHIDKRRIHYEDIALAQMTLRDVMEHIVPATRYDGSAPYADFSGTANEISFIAPPREVQAPNSLQRYKVQLAANGDVRLTSSNILSRTANAFSDSDSTRRAATLLDDVQQLDIAYYGIASTDTKLRWHPRWVRQPKAPEAIRLRMTFGSGNQHVWPEFIVKPATMIDSDCNISIETGNCRGRI